ncbi:hypothetical protein LLH23_04240 [bacterium]|nr:hypothetical protein [bacterium]
MSESEICCCHEAGHAVTDEEIGRHVEWVECEHGSGETRSTDCDGDGEATRYYKRLVSLHAGVWAEVRFNHLAQGEECHHDWQCIQDAMAALAHLLHSDDAAGRLNMRAMAWVNENMPKCVPAIKAVASALVGQARTNGEDKARLTGVEVRAIIAASRE